MDAFTDILGLLIAGRELTESQVRCVMHGILHGDHDEGQAAGWLVALAMKGETAVEVAAAAAVLREHMVRWDPELPGVVDTCGTGGDGSGTFNISTATAIVLAGAGVPVVKHGNRGASSPFGSSDVLEALGVQALADPAAAKRALHETGLAFCFAPNFHPAMRHVATLRRRLGCRTIFNCLGPLANPACAPRQVLGVGRPRLLEVIAGALVRLGTEHSLVVCGSDGLDEVSLSAPTQVRQVRGGELFAWEWTATDFGLPACSIAELSARDAAESAVIIHKVLQAEPGAALNIVLANAAAGLIVAGRVATPKDGVAIAREAIQAGAALRVLERLRKLTWD
jgi:anthranilate phosphoribosyltransferase